MTPPLTPQLQWLQPLPPLLQESLLPRLSHLSHFPQSEAHARHLVKLLASSDFLTRIAERPPIDLETLYSEERLLTPYQTGDHLRQLENFIPAPKQLSELKQGLRRYRQLAMFTIAWRDLITDTDLSETFLSLSELAEASIRHTLRFLVEWNLPRYGRALDSQGRPLELLVLGMGKLGGEELNFSSDVDLIFFYAEEGKTDGSRRISNAEYFTQIGKSLINALDDRTEDGFVFRVDMRLRPFGQSGPLVMSFDAAEHYYQAHGRTWERYAMLKARAVAGNLADANQFFSMIRPFIYRRYIDFSVIESLREIKQRISQEMCKEQDANHIKIGRGGIREVEFIVQAFQLTRGGKEPSLQVRSILLAFERLKTLKLLPSKTIKELRNAYLFLRKTENCLQIINDEQTHTLPSSELDRTRLITLLDFESWHAFLQTLERHRDTVHRHFVASISIDDESPENAPIEADTPQLYVEIWRQHGSKESQLERLEQAGLLPTEEVLEALIYLKNSAGYRILTETGRHRFDRLIPTLLLKTLAYPEPAPLLKRLFVLLQRVISRSCYIALLTENPPALDQLIKLCAASPWIAESLAAQPTLFDDLLSPETLYQPLRRDELQIDLERRLQLIDADDLDQQMDELRRFAHTHRLRVAAADIVGSLPIMKVSDCLTEIAEVVLKKCLTLAWENLLARHGRPTAMVDGKRFYPDFLMVAYGKLGGIELGYSSDLDLVFIHDSQGEETQTLGPRVIDNSDFFIRLGKKIIHFLTTRTAAGILYDIDMRLRPSGNSGLLVVNTEAFAQYQRDSAWTWEHQAIIRARPIAGSQRIARFFEALRIEVVHQDRAPEQLKSDIIEMRDRLHEHYPSSKNYFDLKWGEGGITDIEFLVQFFVLKWARYSPGLIRYTDNIRLLECLAESGRLDQKTVSFMMDAYRAYRTRVHRLALQAKSPHISPNEEMEFRCGIGRIWTEHLGTKRTSGPPPDGTEQR